jgi:hypothetical protein
VAGYDDDAPVILRTSDLLLLLSGVDLALRLMTSTSRYPRRGLIDSAPNAWMSSVCSAMTSFSRWFSSSGWGTVRASSRV